MNDYVLNVAMAATHNTALIAVGIATGNLDNMELVCTGDGKPFISDRLPSKLIERIKKAFKDTGIQLVKLQVREQNASNLVLPS